MLKIHNLLQNHNKRIILIFTPLIMCAILLFMPVSKYTLISYCVSVLLEILVCIGLTWSDLKLKY